MAKNTEIPIRVLKEETVFDGHWLQTNRLQVAKGEVQENWEVIRRHLKPGKAIHGAYLIPILIRNREKFIVLVNEFRIPLMDYVLQFVGGMAKEGETIEKTAERELFEETGYTGKAVKVTEGLAAQEPSVMFNLCKFVQMEIDGDSPVNRSPRQNLPSDEIETIEVKVIPLQGVDEFLNSWAASGRYVQADLFAFALGLQLNF